MNPLLHEFLLLYDLYPKFISNCYKDDPEVVIEAIDSISDAFTWENTFEGVEYWTIQHDKFIKFKEIINHGLK